MVRDFLSGCNVFLPVFARLRKIKVTDGKIDAILMKEHLWKAILYKKRRIMIWLV